MKTFTDLLIDHEQMIFSSPTPFSWKGFWKPLVLSQQGFQKPEIAHLTGIQKLLQRVFKQIGKNVYLKGFVESIHETTRGFQKSFHGCTGSF